MKHTTGFVPNDLVFVGVGSLIIFNNILLSSISAKQVK